MHGRYRLFLASLIVTSLVGAADIKPITLQSAGSTFIYPILKKWCAEYRRAHPETEVFYDPVGSSHGISRTLAGSVDFGASDGPLTDAQLQHAGRKIAHVPVVLGAVVPAYNLPGVKQSLHFTPAALAGIFLGTITRWNDPELTHANPGVALPNHELTVVYRADGSGTTYVWTDYLSKVSGPWAKRVGRGTSVRFPVGSGVPYNEGVREVIQGQPYSIGYLQVTYAVEGHVQWGLVENQAGKYVRADKAAITAAAVAAAKTMPVDFRVSITNSPAADAYPISSFSWLLIPERIEDAAKRRAITEFVHWILTDGQTFAGPLDYAPLPGDVTGSVLKALNRIR